MCCAITAARAGLKVVLATDSPVLGGNASLERPHQHHQNARFDRRGQRPPRNDYGGQIGREVLEVRTVAECAGSIKDSPILTDGRTLISASAAVA